MVEGEILCELIVLTLNPFKKLKITFSHKQTAKLNKQGSRVNKLIRRRQTPMMVCFKMIISEKAFQGCENLGGLLV